MPADITVGTDAGLSTAVVNYTATATDNVGLASSNCTPTSASTFSLGTTTVNCTATDTAGNTANASFDVTVEATADSIDVLIASIEALGLPNGAERSLIAPIRRAPELLEDGNPNNDQAVCDKLDSFLDHVQDRLAANDITQALADAMTSFGQAIKNDVGCP